MFQGTMSGVCGAGMMAGMWLLSVPIVVLIAAFVYIGIRAAVHHEVRLELARRNASPQTGLARRGSGEM